jgi:uncharacterized membrane protein
VRSSEEDDASAVSLTAAQSTTDCQPLVSQSDNKTVKAAWWIATAALAAGAWFAFAMAGGHIWAADRLLTPDPTLQDAHVALAVQALLLSVALALAAVVVAIIGVRRRRRSERY